MRRRELPTEHRSQAPLRLDFAGGWTDVPPFSRREGGVVVNGALELYARAELKIGGTLIRLVSEDLDLSVECANAGGLVLDGRLDLHKCGLRMFPVTGGLTLTTKSDAPPGSGLGSSGALDVALVALLTRARQDAPSEREIAEYGWHLEVVEAGNPGGKQDQYAAAFGGFNLIEFHRDSTLVNPLRIRPEVIAELEYRLLLCYMGQTRQSANIIERQVESYRQGKGATVEALHRLKAETVEMKRALLLGDIDGMGELLHQAWEHKKQLDKGISNSHVDRLYQLARREGAIGGKMPGAGGGGYFLLLTRFDRKHRVAAVLEKHGGQVVPFQFERRGMTAWSFAGTERARRRARTPAS